jgi:hypothetical protein
MHEFVRCLGVHIRCGHEKLGRVRLLRLLMGLDVSVASYGKCEHNHHVSPPRPTTSPPNNTTILVRVITDSQTLANPLGKRFLTCPSYHHHPRGPPQRRTPNPFPGTD